MSRLPLVDPATAPAAARPMLDAVGKKLGRVPNLLRGLANAPAALKAYLELSGALAGGTLTARAREQIALTVAEVNDCGYCLAAHTAIGASLGLTADALAAARAAKADDARTAAVLRFARALVVKRGLASDADLRDVRAAGVTDAEITETVAVAALNVFTNWFNHVAQTPVDFPAVAPLAPPAHSCSTPSCAS